MIEKSPCRGRALRWRGQGAKLCFRFFQELIDLALQRALVLPSEKNFLGQEEGFFSTGCVGEDANPQLSVMPNLSVQCQSDDWSFWFLSQNAIRWDLQGQVQRPVPVRRNEMAALVMTVISASHYLFANQCCRLQVGIFW